MTIRSLSFDLEELPVQGGAPPSHWTQEKSGGKPPQKEPNHKLTQPRRARLSRTPSSSSQEEDQAASHPP